MVVAMSTLCATTLLVALPALVYLAIREMASAVQVNT